MYRIIICAAVGTLFSQAVAQEKVSFASTDGDLKGGNDLDAALLGRKGTVFGRIG
jgi:hypothetical protein